MNAEVKAFLNRPRNLLAEIKRTQSQIDGLRQGMLPSGICYDLDKVISSPSDPMPQYAARVDELQEYLNALRVAYWSALDEITNAAVQLNDSEQLVIMLRYVSQRRWPQVAAEMGQTERWMFTIHRRATKNLEKIIKGVQ